MSLFDLTGKVALTTGTTKGIGLAMATAMAEHGASVMVSSRKADAVEAAVAEINEAAGRDAAQGIPCNAGDKDALQTLVDETKARFGGIDIVLGNAAANPYYGPTPGINDEQYAKTMDVNVLSNLWLAQMCGPELAARGGGSMIFTSSIGAFRHSPGLGIYGVSKLALLGVVRSLAVEMGPQNIRVNAICPGVFETEFAEALWNNPKAQEMAKKMVPLGRFGDPEDIKGLGVFLASDASRYITGQAHNICGGSQPWD